MTPKPLARQGCTGFLALILPWGTPIQPQSQVKLRDTRGEDGNDHDCYV